MSDSPTPEPATCGVLVGLKASGGPPWRLEECGAPADARYSRMLGDPHCEDHGEDAVKELMSE